MKKLILILLVTLIGIISCVKNEIIYDPWMVSNSFQDVCKYDENTTYYMSCNANREDVELYFARKIKWRWGVEEKNFGDEIYYMENYSVSVYNENYKYTPSEFRDLLIETNQIPRDTTIFRFTTTMYCSWDVFDKIYKAYIK